MSNDGSWQPPGAEPGPPPPPPPPGSGDDAGRTAGAAEASVDAPLAPTEASGSGRSTGRLVALVVGVVVLVAAGVFAISRLVGGDSAAGGAESPEAAGLALLGAVEDEDVLGMIDVLLPGERETFRDPAGDLAEHLRRLDVLSDDASLSDVGGIDVVVESETADAEPTNVEDITNLVLSGTISVSVDGEALPIGDLVYDNVPNVDPAEANLDATEPEPFDLPLTAVREDGRWYVSLFHTVAEVARQRTGIDIPAAGIAPTGGDSPEDAFDSFLDGVEALDLSAIIASLNPQEFQALQRYAPAFIDDGQAELDAAGVEITLDEADYAVAGDGAQRSITVTYLSGAITAQNDTVTFEFEDGCLRAAGSDPGETIDTCELQEGATAEDIFGTDAEVVDDLLTTLGDAMGDYDNPGIIVRQVDGTWFLSPLATGSEQVLAFLAAFDRDEIESIGDEISQLADDVLTSAGDIGLPGDLGGAEPLEPLEPPATVVEEAPVDTTTEATSPAITAPGSDVPATEADAGSECYVAESATDAAACFEALMATGEVSPTTVPVHLRALECGLAELFWSGDYYALPDAEFVAAVEAAAPCYADLVADGTLAELDIPLELSDPQCLEGRNWYAATDDDAYFDRLFECAYG